ncbi:MAG: hypothetical protein ACSHX8_10770 [Opitutaceae bacterium]
MKALLLACGSIGLIASAPISYYLWMMLKGFGGPLGALGALLIFSPIGFALMLIFGLFWPREEKNTD